MSRTDLYNALLESGFDTRKTQKRMFEIIENYLNKKYSVVMIEAPTGTGKSFGYLLPIIQRNEKAIISTRSKILQEQLRRDLQRLSNLSIRTFNRPIKYLILKGKSNYLCLDRLYDRLNQKEDNVNNKEQEQKQQKPKQKMMDVGKKTKEAIKENKEKSILHEIASLIETEWDGDREHVRVGIKNELWSEINIDDDYCDASYRSKCKYAERCYYYSKIKKEEKLADIIVVNHALLALREFSDTENKILVIDEAHELDESLVLARTQTLSVIGIKRIISQIKERLNDSEDALNSVNVLDVFKNLFEKYFKDKNKNSVPIDEPFFVEEIIDKIYKPIQDTFYKVEKNLKKKVENMLKSMTSVPQSLLDFIADSNFFDKNEFSRIKKELPINDDLHHQGTMQEKELKRVILHFRMLSRRILRMKEVLASMKDKKKKDSLGFAISRAYSKELEDFNYKIELFPIFPKNVLDVNEYKSVILTSATLNKELIAMTTGISGDYYRLEHIFDYSRVEFIIKKVNPKQELDKWRQAISDAYKYLRSKHKKILVLLTSKEQFDYIEKTNDVLFQESIPLSMAIELIISGDKNVLVGLDSLWTGLDIKGEKGILMSKLPFDAPDEPLHYHRVRYLKRHKQDEFEYIKQRLLIRFKQGFGRLVRDKNDKGTIILCDERILKYKELYNFLRELDVKIKVID